MFLSDCGKYIALPLPQFGGGAFDVIAVDGSRQWLHRRYQPTGFDDQDPRYKYPEFPHMVDSFSNRGHRKRSGRWVDDFELSFSDYDTSIKIDLWKGNAVIKAYGARFRKRIKKLAWKHVRG